MNMHYLDCYTIIQSESLPNPAHPTYHYDHASLLEITLNFRPMLTRHWWPSSSPTSGRRHFL